MKGLIAAAVLILGASQAAFGADGEYRCWAKDNAGRDFLGRSNRSMARAEQKAMQNCQTYTTVGGCRIVYNYCYFEENEQNSNDN